MSYCRMCGAYIPIDETVCTACGHDTAGGDAPRGAAPGQAGGKKGQSTASQGYYTQDQSQGGASQAQSSETRGQYQAQDHSQRQYEEPWNRAADREPWSDGRRAQSTGRARNKGKASPPRQGTEESRSESFTIPDDITSNRYLCILCYLGPLFLIPYLLRRDSPYVRFHANQGLILFIFNVLLQVAGNFVPFFHWVVGLVGGIFALVCFFKGLGSTLNGRLDKLPLIGDINLIR